MFNGIQFTKDTKDVYCDVARKAAKTNFDGFAHFCQYCGSINHIEGGEIKLNREYYVNRILPAYGNTLGHDTSLRGFGSEAELLEHVRDQETLDKHLDKLRYVRCDGVMRYSSDFNIWREDYRIIYTYHVERKVWVFDSHYEGLNKLPR